MFHRFFLTVNILPLKLLLSLFLLKIYCTTSLLLHDTYTWCNRSYHIAGMFGGGGGSLANLAKHQHFTELKPSKLVKINNLLVDFFIYQTFFRLNFYPSTFAKHYHRQTFLLYGIIHCSLGVSLHTVSLYSLLVPDSSCAYLCRQNVV